jgi:hypothetical protein
VTQSKTTLNEKAVYIVLFGVIAFLTSVLLFDASSVWRISNDCELFCTESERSDMKALAKERTDNFNEIMRLENAIKKLEIIEKELLEKSKIVI